MDRKSFDQFIINCDKLNLPYLENFDRLKTAILFQVFYYCLFKSGVVFEHEELSPLEFSGQDGQYPAGFEINCRADIDFTGYYVPGIFSLVAGHIAENLEEYPLYFLGGYFYENLLARTRGDTPGVITCDRRHIKTNGIFYTPSAAAENFIKGIFDNIDFENVNIPGIKILDLACGCGVFSILWLKLAVENTPGIFMANDFAPDSRYGVLTKTRLSLLKNIRAIDNDDTSLKIAGYSLALYCLMDEKNIIGMSEFGDLCGRLKTALVKKDVIDIYRRDPGDFENLSAPKYDVVISNPPYIAYYSRFSKADRRLQSDLPLMKKNLETIDPEASPRNRGRLNSIMFFIDYALRSLSPNGYLALLVDMNIHEPLFSGVRKRLLENLALLEIRINARNFPGVNSGQAFAYLRNVKPGPGNEVKIRNEENNETQIVAQKTLEKNLAFYIPKNPGAFYGMEKLPVLGDHCHITTGVNIGGASEFFFCYRRDDHDGDRGADKALYPVITPAQLKRPYDPVPTRHELFIDFNKELAARVNRNSREANNNSVIALGPLERFLQPKLFVRQSAPRIIATYCEEAVVSPYSIFVVNQEGDYSLLVLLALVNSDLVSHYCRAKGLILRGPGKQPQIRKSALQMIPVPEPEMYNRHKDETENLVRQILKTSGDNDDDLEKREAIKEEIEKLVCFMYKVKYETSHI